MSVASVPLPEPMPAQPQKIVAVEFFTTDGEPHPSHLIFALAGVGAALARLEPTLGDRKDFEMIGNLGVAAHVLAKQLTERMA